MVEREHENNLLSYNMKSQGRVPQGWLLRGLGISCRFCFAMLACCPFAQVDSPHYHKMMALARHKVQR